MPVTRLIRLLKKSARQVCRQAFIIMKWSLLKMQFQTEVINLGYKASDYFTKYPGRFISSHLSDWTPDKKETPIGKGVINWKEYFAAAETGGVQYFFVEMDLTKFKDSAAYIHELLK